MKSLVRNGRLGMKSSHVLSALGALVIVSVASTAGAYDPGPCPPGTIVHGIVRPDQCAGIVAPRPANESTVLAHVATSLWRQIRDLFASASPAAE